MSSTPMNPEYKAKWIAALRSGEYQQTKNMLRNSAGGMCCLGVLCDVVEPDGWGKPSSLNPGIEHTNDMLMLPDHIAKTTGIDTCQDEEHTQANLASMNDGDKSFEFIADWIEANL